jgi:hypothetical protein
MPSATQIRVFVNSSTSQPNVEKRAKHVDATKACAHHKGIKVGFRHLVEV